MGPDLELKEKPRLAMEALDSKANNNGVPQDLEGKAVMRCASNCEDKSFHDEVLPNHEAKVSDDFEDVEVNIIECAKSVEIGQAEPRCEDATESMSSFGDTVSGSESGVAVDDTELESQLCIGDDDAPAASIFDGYTGAFGMRKKKLTDHWRRFIRPLMWRCKWIELQIKEFQSQALKYDRELAEHEQKKEFDFETVMVEGFDAKSRPYSGCIQRNKIMKRKRRKRFEDTTDIASYMLHHNLFSYYENKKSATDVASMDVNFGNQDKAINGSNNFGFQDGLEALESTGPDVVCEDILRKIEVLQSQVRKLKARVDKVVIENPAKFASLNRLSLAAPCDALNSTDPNSASPPENGVSSHGEVIPFLDMIGSAGQPQIGMLYENVQDGTLIHYQATNEELLNFKDVGSQLAEKPQLSTEKQTAGASEADLSKEMLVPRIGYGGKSLPKSRSNVSNSMGGKSLPKSLSNVSNNSGGKSLPKSLSNVSNTNGGKSLPKSRSKVPTKKGKRGRGRRS